MYLSEKNINEILPGLEVISAINTPGKVMQVIKEEDNKMKEPHSRVRYDTVKIDWENGRHSTVFHMQTDSIKIK